MRQIWGLDLVAVSTATATSYVHHDRLGSVTQSTDATGNVTGAVTYDEWGVPSGDLALANYTGHDYDAVLGVYFAQARVYDSQNRRFAARDPVRGAVVKNETLNAYIYVYNNPMRYTDVFGLFAKIKLYINGTLETHDFPYTKGTMWEEKFAETLKQNNPDLYRRYMESDAEYEKLTQKVIDYRNNGYADCISEWEEHPGTRIVVINTAMKNRAVQIVRTGGSVSIKVHVNYFGDDAFKVAAGENPNKYTYADLVEQGFKMWAGEYSANTLDTSQNSLLAQYYDSFGCNKKVTVSVEVIRGTSSVDAKGQQYTPIQINSLGRSGTNFFKDWPWAVDYTGSMFLYIRESGQSVPYTINQFKIVAAHEFGHMLGIGDAYGEGDKRPEAQRTAEVPALDIMRTTINPVFTSNDIEMILAAWQFNAYQEFVTYTKTGSGTPFEVSKSEVIRLP